jgi:hypothetical protein
MKQLLLAGTAALAIAVSHPAANATPIVFDFAYTGGLVAFTVPSTGSYQIIAFSWSAPIIRRWSSPARAVGPGSSLVALVAPARAAAPEAVSLAATGAAPVTAGRAVTAEEVAVCSGASLVVAGVVASSPPAVMASVHLTLPLLAAGEGAAAPSQFSLEAAAAAPLTSMAQTGASVVAAEAAGISPSQVGVEAAALAVVEVAAGTPRAAAAPSMQEQIKF